MGVIWRICDKYPFFFCRFVCGGVLLSWLTDGKTRPGYLYYNLSPSRVLYITQRMPIIPVFPCKFSIYVEDNLHGLVEESYKRELKNEQQKKINTL